jgi:hypothetical protein
MGKATVARCAFQQTEVSSEEAREYLQHVGRDDWREEFEGALER